MLQLIKKVALATVLSVYFGVAAHGAEKTAVFVSIVPQKYFVQQIGKELVDVQVLVPPGADPHTYEPSPQQMVALAKAKVYFAIGVEFEAAKLPKISAANPKLKIVHTDDGIDKIAMAAHHHHEDHEKDAHHHDDLHKKDDHHHEKTHPKKDAHHKDDHDDHDHGGLDPHIWLAPALVKAQADTILNALQQIDPAHKEVLAANHSEFVSRIDQLDHDLKQLFAGKKGLKFMVFHPAWGYFAHAYGLEQVPVEIEGKEPKPAQLKELIKHSKEKGIRVVFVQPQFSTKSAEVLAKEIGGQVVFANPLAEDWMANLREVAGKFKAAIK